jgi:hypothetical protein
MDIYQILALTRRFRQVYCIFLFLAAASLFGTLISQVHRSLAAPFKA